MKISKVLLLRLGSPQIYKKHKHPRNILPPIFLGYIMSLIENKYETKFFDSRLENYFELMKKCIEFRPHITIAYFMTYDYDFSMKFLKKLKKITKTKIICIGQHASFAPESLIYKNSPVDYVFMGESELLIPQFLDELSSGKIKKIFKSLYFLGKKKAPQIEIIKNLNVLPLPKHELFNPSDYKSVYPLPLTEKAKWGYILATRGCPYNCIFCSPTIRESFGKEFRARSVKNVVDEMEYLKNLGINVISFLDDTPTISRKFMYELCNEIIRRKLKIKWICHGRLDQLDKKLMKKMKIAGCCLVKIGVESASNRVIGVLKKTFYKFDWKTRAKKFFEEAKEVGLPILAMFILGSPTETKRDVLETIKFIREIEPEILQIAYFTPYPGSSAYFKFLKKNKMKFDERFYHYNPDFINLSELSDKELKNYQKKIYRMFYLRPFFIFKHLRKYLIFYIFNPSYIKNLFPIF